MKSTYVHAFWTPGPEQLACGLALTAVGHYRAHDHRLVDRTLDEAVVGLIAEGRGWLRIGRRRWRCEAPGLWVCPPQLAHGYGCDAQCGWDLWWLHGRGCHLERVLAYAGFSAATPWQAMADADPTRSRFRELLAHTRRAGATDACAVMAKLGTLLHHLPADLSDSDAIGSNGLGLLDHRTTDLAGPAAAAGCSVPQYIKRFKRATGRTPWQYVLARRIDRACDLLASDERSIAAVAADAGFDDPDYFARIFRRRVGCAPTAFRRQYRNTAGDY